MINIIDQKVISSFKEFLSYKLNEEYRAFSNKTVQLFKYTGVRNFLNKETYGSIYPQWIYDDSISGAQIPTGYSSLERGQSGLSFDFKNGRVFVDSGTPVSGTLNVSVPEFNIYVTTTPVQKLILENKFLYPPDLKAGTQQIAPDSIVVPCIFLSFTNTLNSVYALGGLEETIFSVQVAVFAENLNQIFGVQKVIRDLTRRVIPLLPFTPFNELNDLKYGYWNYKMILDNVVDRSQHLFVNQSNFKVLDLDYVNQEHPNIIVGLGNASVSIFRTTETIDSFDFPTVYQDENELIFYTFNDNSLSEHSN